MSKRTLQSHRGSCHCGAIQFEIQTDFPELTTCNCSMCRRRSTLMVKVHEDDFKLLSGEDSLTKYQFHTHTARHFFCKHCGIYPFHRKRTAPDSYGINVHCLETKDLEDIPIRETNGIDLP